LLELENVAFHVSDVHALDARGTYDAVLALDVLHDLARPPAAAGRIERGLRPGGTLLAIEIAASRELQRNLENPIAPALYATSIFHCMSASLARGGEGLGACWGIENVLAMLEAAGFADVREHRVQGDLLHAVVTARKG
jgi:2-polyprenyl-3-methyl-5-hydroxy-6-metoxy-1,4-benzoquinol methylase